jgi:hypothetical protein
MAIYPVHPWIDSTYTPVYHVTYPSYDAADPRQLAKYNAEHKSLYAVMAAWTSTRTSAYSFSVDLSNVRSSALSRQHVIQYLELVRKRTSQHLACRAFVAPNEAVRGVATAVFWQSPPDYPHRFFDNVPEARAWALDQTLALERQDARASLGPRRGH